MKTIEAKQTMNINFSSISVLNGENVVDQKNYSLYFYPRGSNEGIYIDESSEDAQANVGYNLILAVGKDAYFGYTAFSSEVYINPANSKIFLKKDLNDDALHESNELSVEYTGFPYSPVVVVSSGNDIIYQKYGSWVAHYESEGNVPIDYKFDEYEAYRCILSDNISVGNAYVEVCPTHMGDGTSPEEVGFFIVPFNLSNASIFGISDEYEYKGAAIQPSISVMNRNNAAFSQDIGYSISYISCEWIGVAQVSVDGFMNLCGSQSAQFKIVGNLNDTDIVLSSPYIQYDGNSQKSNILDVMLYGRSLSSQANYFISYDIASDWINPGEKRPIAKGIEAGYCIGSKSCSFIVYDNLTSENFVFSGIKESYDLDDGQQIDLHVTVVFNGKNENGSIKQIILNDGDDIHITYPEDYMSSGEKHIVIEGVKPWWQGTKTLSFNVYGVEETRAWYADGSVRYIDNPNLKRSDFAVSDSIFGDQSIKKVRFGSAVESLEDNILSNCIMLEEADFGKCSEDVEIPEGCFDGCSCLRKVVFPGERNAD